MYTQVLQLVTQLLRDLDNCKVVTAPSSAVTSLHFQITICHPVAVFAFGLLTFVLSPGHPLEISQLKSCNSATASTTPV